MKGESGKNILWLGGVIALVVQDLNSNILLEKYYVHNIFTINIKWQIVTGYYYWVRK